MAFEVLSAVVKSAVVPSAKSVFESSDGIINDCVSSKPEKEPLFSRYVVEIFVKHVLSKYFWSTSFKKFETAIGEVLMSVLSVMLPFW